MWGCSVARTVLHPKKTTRVEDFLITLVFKTRVEVFSLITRYYCKDGKFVVGERPLPLPLEVPLL